MGSDLNTTFLHHSHIKVASEPPSSEAWSDSFEDFDCLAVGIDRETGLPVAEDPDGTIWKFILIFGQGDCEILVTWGIPSYNAADIICECGANRSDKAYTDLRDGAPWRPGELLIDNTAFLLLCRRGHPIREGHYFNLWF